MNMDDATTPSIRRMPERLCVACRKLRPKDQLVRLVRTPDQQVVLDAGGKVQGRGAYACLDQPCLEKATRKGGFARALRQPVPEAIVQMLFKPAMPNSTVTTTTVQTLEGQAHG